MTMSFGSASKRRNGKNGNGALRRASISSRTGMDDADADAVLAAGLDALAARAGKILIERIAPAGIKANRVPTAAKNTPVTPRVMRTAGLDPSGAL